MQDNGYLKLSLWHDNNGTMRWVHQLVCEAFNGPRPPGRVAAHDNGISADNRAENLLWKTNAENTEDMVRHGTRRRGEKCCTHLTAAQVLIIRERIASAPRSTGGKRVKKGYVAAVLQEFRLSQAGLWNIIKRNHWSHI